jgi:capsular polysaccharide transport system permease protein
MKLRRLARALIFVDTDHQVPAARRDDRMLVGTGTRLVPTIYEDLRRQRHRRRLAMVLWIALPTLMASLYFGLIASDRYVSDTQMVLSQQSGESAPDLASLGGANGKSAILSLIGMSGGDSEQTNESAIVTNYLQSIEAMEALDRAIGLRKMWSAPSIDYLSRLAPDASDEEFHRYYEKHVTVIADPLDPVIEVKVEAFRPEDAQLIGKTLVRLAQDKLNSTYLGIREDALRFARSEVANAEARLAGINEKLRKFRNAHADIDPTSSAQAVGSVAGGLFGQLAGAEADLRTTLSYARPNNPQVMALKARIAALKEQIAADRGLLAGDAASPGSKPYADLLAAYEDLLLDQKFGQASYTSAMAFLSSSRASLVQQHTYLIDFLAPTLPQDALEPRRARDVVMAFSASVLLCLVASLVSSALREHARQ